MLDNSDTERSVGGNLVQKEAEGSGESGGSDTILRRWERRAASGKAGTAPSAPREATQIRGGRRRPA